RDANLALGRAVDLARRKRRVVAADGHQGVDAQVVENVQDVAHILRRLGWVGSGRAQHGAAAVVDVLDILDGEPAKHAGVAPDQVLEAVGNAVNFDAVIDGLDGGRTDDAVDAGSGTATDQECHFADSRCTAHAARSPEKNPRAASRGSGGSVQPCPY